MFNSPLFPLRCVNFYIRSQEGRSASAGVVGAYPDIPSLEREPIRANREFREFNFGPSVTEEVKQRETFRDVFENNVV